MSSPRKSKEELSQQVGTVVAGVKKEQRSKTPSERAAAANRKSVTQTAVAEVTVGKAAQSIANLGVSIQGALNSVNTELQTQLAELARVEEAIKLKNLELEELHGKDVLASALDTLVTNYETTKTEQATEMAAQRANWQVEQDVHYRQNVARDTSLLESRKRDEEQYVYTRDLNRKVATDQWNDSVRAKEREQAEKERVFTLNHAEREENLKLRELDYVVRRQQMENMLIEAKNDSTKQLNAALSGQKRDYEHQIDLLKRDSDTDKKLLTQQVTTLNDTVSTLRTQLASTQAQVTEATMKVAEIASKAIEGASGKLALDTAMQIKNNDGNGTSRKS